MKIISELCRCRMGKVQSGKAAGEVIAANDKLAWMEGKKDWLKDNRWKDVLGALRPA
jgi:hypothetical protein